MTEANWGIPADAWRAVSAPYIPDAEDIALLQQACSSAFTSGADALRILVLGVTPALIDAPWQAHCEIHAVDFDATMIGSLWKPRAGASCHLADWNELPFPDDYFDLVIGDCSFNALPGMDSYDSVLREIVRVKRPSAALVTRFFMQASPRLTLTDLMQDGRVEGFRFADKRLLILIAASDSAGSIKARSVPNLIGEQCGPLTDYLTALRMAPEEVEWAIKTYDFGTQLNFPSKADIRARFNAYFSTMDFTYPGYVTGAYCPTVRCV
jgi:hypothetical protein